MQLKAPKFAVVVNLNDRSMEHESYRSEIIVACFGKFRHFDRLLQGFRKRGASQFVTSAKQLAQKIQRIASKDVSQKRTSLEHYNSIAAASVVSDYSPQPITVMDT